MAEVSGIQLILKHECTTRLTTVYHAHTVPSIANIGEQSLGNESIAY